MNHKPDSTWSATNVSSRLLALLGASLLLVACGGGSLTTVSGSATSAMVSTAAGSPSSNLGFTPPTDIQPDIPPDNGTTVQSVGIGLNMLSYWGGAHATADLVLESSFRSMTWAYPTVDANGWPTQDFYLLHPKGPVGIYKIIFNGQATITGPGTIQNQVYDSNTNTTTADYVVSSFPNPNTSTSVYDRFINTKLTAGASVNSGISNLRFYRPGYPTDGSAVFTSEFISAMRKFKVVRFMDFVNANGNSAQTWSDRSHMLMAGAPESAVGSPWSLDYAGTDTVFNSTNSAGWFPGPPPGFRSTKGQPWELVVLLANAAGVDVWLNVPVRADDTYITNLAKLLKYGSDGINPYDSPQANPIYPPLNPNLKVYLEYGNEVWNSGPGFRGFPWVKDLSDSVRNDTTHPIAYDGVVTDQYRALYRYIAYRSSTISLLFRQVFGAENMMTKIRPILATQAGNANSIYRTELSWANGFYSLVRPNNPLVYKVKDIWYGGGGAAYYGSTINPLDSLPSTMATYFSGMPTPSFFTTATIDSVYSRAYGILPTAYEGGPGPGGGIYGQTGYITANDILAYNADPRMIPCMLSAQDAWNAAGGDLNMFYVYQGTKSWDFSTGLAGIADTDTVKLQAVDAINIKDKAAVTIGTSMPGSTVLKTAQNAIWTGVSNIAWYLDGTYMRVDGTGAETMLVPIRVSTAGIYNVQVTTIDSTGQAIALYVNGDYASQWLPASDNTHTNKATDVITVTLPQGLSVLRIQGVVGTTWIHDLIVTKP